MSKALTIPSVPFLLKVRPGLCEGVTPRQLARIRKRVNQGKVLIGPPESDTEFESKTLREVRPGSSDGWEITFDDGWSFLVPAHSSVVPKKGGKVRTYGEGIGRPVRGLVIDGVTVFYKTKAEQEAEHRRWCQNHERDQRKRFKKARAQMDATYAALPDIFRQRIDRFRAANPDFRQKYEGYELFTCEQAVKIALALGNDEAIERFKKLPFEQQLAAVPGLSDGHSGNTFGCACFLARLYVTNKDKVAEVTGAMSPLVGTADYSEKAS